MLPVIHRIAAILALLGAVTGLGVTAPDREPAEETVKDRDGFLPVRQYKPLAGKAVGVLVSQPREAVALDGRSGPTDALCFSRDGASYRWVYVPVEEKPTITGLKLPVGEKGETSKLFDRLSMANPETVKPWGVSEPYALVEVEVNDGLGSPASEGFVATQMKVLDGSREFPLKVAEVIAGLRKRYQSDLRNQQKAIDAGLAAAQKAALKGQAATGPRETSEVMYVTWLPDTHELEVRFRSRVTDGAYQYGLGIQPAVDDEDQAPGRLRRPPPPRQGMRFGTMFGIDWGRGYTVSKTGAVHRIMTLPLQSFTRVLPPPV